MPSAVTHLNAVLDGRTVWFAGGFKDGYKATRSPWSGATTWEGGLPHEEALAVRDA